MLVLTRRKDESIVIAGNIEITVVDVDRNGSVRLGVKAPSNMKILRRELIDEVAEANQAASVSLAAAEAAKQFALRFKPNRSGDEP